MRNQKWSIETVKLVFEDWNINRAKLELFEDIRVEKSAIVNIALQLDNGGRVMGQVENTSTILQAIQCK